MSARLRELGHSLIQYGSALGIGWVGLVITFVGGVLGLLQQLVDSKVLEPVIDSSPVLPAWGWYAISVAGLVAGGFAGFHKIRLERDGLKKQLEAGVVPNDQHDALANDNALLTQQKQQLSRELTVRTKQATEFQALTLKLADLAFFLWLPKNDHWEARGGHTIPRQVFKDFYMPVGYQATSLLVSLAGQVVKADVVSAFVVQPSYEFAEKLHRLLDQPRSSLPVSVAVAWNRLYNRLTKLVIDAYAGDTATSKAPAFRDWSEAHGKLHDSLRRLVNDDSLRAWTARERLLTLYDESAFPWMKGG